MSKIGRNEPCPCGSGKKYKKCCGKTESLADFKANIFEERVDYMLSLVFEDLSQNMQRLPLLLVNMLGSDLNIRPELREKIEAISINPDDVFEDVEIMPLIECLIFDYRAFGDKTIFEKHLSREQRTFRTFIIDSFAQWRDSYVSIYKVLEIIAEETTFLLEDILLEQVVSVKTMNISPEDIQVNDLLATRLLSKGDTYEILGYTTFPEIIKDALYEKMSELRISKGEGFKLGWPDFLKQYGYLVLLSSIEKANQISSSDFEHLRFQRFKESLEWFDEKQRQVARLIEDNLKAEYSLEDIAFALKLWNQYCFDLNPRITKLETLVASVEYIISNTLGMGKTQVQIAEKYGVSPSSISSRSSEMTYILYDLIESEPEEDDNEAEITPRLLAEESLFEINAFLQREGSKVVHDYENGYDNFNEFLLENYEKIVCENQLYGSSRFKAQKLLYEAWNVVDEEEKMNLIHEALRIFPNSPDAYVLQVEAELVKARPDFQKSLQLSRKGVEVGEIDLGEEFFVAHKGNFWNLVETRPYMRARHNLIECLVHQEELTEAITHCQKMLELDSEDHLGIRYILLNLYLRMEHLSDAKELVELFSDDMSAEFCYNRAILEYKLSGPGKTAQRLIQEAIQRNPYVVEYFVGKREIPQVVPECYGLGEEDEALKYIFNNYRLWEENFEFAQWFMEKLSEVR